MIYICNFFSVSWTRKTDLVKTYKVQLLHNLLQLITKRIESFFHKRIKSFFLFK